eukprot:CAMPEP_0178461172 /NCGR_PEP_ID=MMETSP0689_2-20121128/49149_1 /TAXON_ID=160604 /ORGANISM="Amphidinium massartii, Strain CS-259" /LENGTH=34 /DNA_ID= /DNA_START= /DNA_END= /DNA_ORIENTATION=
MSMTQRVYQIWRLSLKENIGGKVPRFDADWSQKN